ncbi:DGQHR domain-containing protein [Methylomonas sp. HW2-6]|uniref:DGQHR domain-containing protein n=1 Tax=Methylomonas sp. HW2-6 TaxID=3376687 RepID=UPI0040439343
MGNNNQFMALRFKQWLSEWDHLDFNHADGRKKPEPTIYIFSMSANKLRRLCGVFPRERDINGATGIQRAHEKDRSTLIRDYVRYGYPYCELTARQRSSFDATNLRKPGWLPTAIVVNILNPNDERRGKKVEPFDAITVEDRDNSTSILSLPDSFSGEDWKPKGFPPLEVIDGQHRLFAFDPSGDIDNFELPIVAFHGLDLGWQAYIFWSINVSPKKINPSHAFDLYPLLRSQDWLEGFSETYIYREARAQELTEILYRHADSPWKHRINMLGEKNKKQVTQAAWVRSLFNTYLASGKGRAPKGLFGCNLSNLHGPLTWSRSQQAAFLIAIWAELETSIRNNTSSSWLQSFDRTNGILDDNFDPAFSGSASLLNQDQGIRGVLSITNDLFYARAIEAGLHKWEIDDISDVETKDHYVSKAYQEIQQQEFYYLIRELCQLLSQYDWRSADLLSGEEKLKKQALRGTGGYGVFKMYLLQFVSEADNPFSACALQLLNNSE